MFSIPQVVETIKKNYDSETDFIKVLYNKYHVLYFRNKDYNTCYIRPVLIKTRNCEEIDPNDIKFIKWTYNPHKVSTYTNNSEEWFYLFIDTKKKTYKGNTYYEHDERPIPEIREKTPIELAAIEKHINDKRIKYQEIKDASNYNSDYYYC